MGSANQYRSEEPDLPPQFTEEKTNKKEDKKSYVEILKSEKKLGLEEGYNSPSCNELWESVLKEKPPTQFPAERRREKTLGCGFGIYISRGNRVRLTVR